MERIELDLTGCETRDVYYVGMYTGIMVQTCILCTYNIIIYILCMLYFWMYCVVVGG